MREISLIENVIAMVQQERPKHSFTHVNMIKLKTGALGPAGPEALRFRTGEGHAPF